MNASCSNSLRHLFAAMATVVLLFGAGVASAQEDVWPLVLEANQAMENWDYVEADGMISALEAEFGEHPGVLYIRGKYLYHMGEYDEAVGLLDRAVEGVANPNTRSNIQTLRDLVASTQGVVAQYATTLTPDGLFEIRYDASRDEVLIPWLGQTLEDAYYNIGYSIGYWPETPIRVEIYPQSRTLAAVSSLTEEAIETSGTIALCKYNKLMFTSPRATARGYGWRDTVSHEYVHYVIGHLVGEGVPIWMHEALAKYLEQRWTGSFDMALDPSAEDLLGDRVEADNLITFEQMHPSMAYLPSQEDAATAYAQVYTVIEYMVDRRGHGVIRELLHTMATGVEVQDAVSLTMGEPFRVFERNWMAYLRERPRVELPGEFREEIQLRPEDADDESVDELAGVEVVEARDYLHLGELLRARNMVEASISEYRRAEELIGSANPVLQNALARAYLDTGTAEEALDAVEDVVVWYPDFYRSHLHEGEALNRLERYDEALVALERAVGINPFDPAVMRELTVAFEGLGDIERAREARRFLAMLDS